MVLSYRSGERFDFHAAVHREQGGHAGRRAGRGEELEGDVRSKEPYLPDAGGVEVRGLLKPHRPLTELGQDSCQRAVLDGSSDRAIRLFQAESALA